MAGGKKNLFFCTDCGYESAKWLGKCPACEAWNTFKEAPKPLAGKSSGRPTSLSISQSVIGEGTILTEPVRLVDVSVEETQRIDTGIAEVNRVLGGGLIPGSSILIGGEPGIGKSTLMLQVSETLHTKRPILYISGEETLSQIKKRALRLELNRHEIEMICETNLSILGPIIEKTKPALIIVDSIQTLFHPEAGGFPGALGQLKVCSFELTNLCKKINASLLLVAHVTKEGTIAGPRAIEHLVDAVLYFDHTDSDMRILRGVKNRFGSTDEIGLFFMGEKGLVEITNPSGLFLEERTGETPPGVSVAAVYEGSRILLVEIQALVVASKGATSRVYSNKIDPVRVSRISAILEKHIGIGFSEFDIYVNVAGGLKISDVGMELPLALALYSARVGLAIEGNVLAVGELSLAGEVRKVGHTGKRIKAAEERRFSKVIGPGDFSNKSYSRVDSIKKAIEIIFK